MWLVDFITHGLVSYLIGRSFGDNYAIFAIVMGILPDFDILLVPFGRKYNNLTLYHRGGVHSLLFLGIATLISAPLANLVAPGNLLIYFGVGFLCACVHLFCDVITTFNIRPFWPFNKKPMKWDITESVNLMGIVFTAVTGLILYDSYWVSFTPEFYIYLMITEVLLVGFLLAQLISKLFVSHRLKSQGTFQTIPTMTPFSWKVVQKETNDQVMKVKFANYNIFSRKPPNFTEYTIKTTPTTPPIESKAQVISFTFQLPEVKRHLWRVHNPLFCVESSEKSWKVYWFSAERRSFNCTFALQVDLETSGKYSVSSKFLRLKNCNQNK